MFHHEEISTVEPQEDPVGNVWDDQPGISRADQADLPDDLRDVDEEDDIEYDDEEDD